MPYYMTQASYTSQALKTMTGNPQDRAATTARMVEAAGGKMLDFFFAFGEYDAVIIWEAPDNATAASVAIAAAGGGALAKISTTVLMTPEEGLEAFRKAGTVAFQCRLEFDPFALGHDRHPVVADRAVDYYLVTNSNAIKAEFDVVESRAEPGCIDKDAGGGTFLDNFRVACNNRNACSVRGISGT